MLVGIIGVVALGCLYFFFMKPSVEQTPTQTSKQSNGDKQPQGQPPSSKTVTPTPISGADFRISGIALLSTTKQTVIEKYGNPNSTQIISQKNAKFEKNIYSGIESFPRGMAKSIGISQSLEASLQ